MALELYNKKRNFAISPEPRGRVGKRKAKALSFVIQKHRASHLHYDFRLELNGVLLSWAVPKGPSLDPAHKRLAMHVEDHPLEYGGFEGTIPPRQYGAGTVLLWDRGIWIPKEDPMAGYKKGRLKFELEGEKLRGGWMLVRSHGGKYGGDKSWLLIKERDEYAKPESEELIVDERPESVASGRVLDEIAADPDRVWHSNKSVRENVKSGAVKKKPLKLAPEKLAGAVKRAIPEFVEPELATLVKEAPADDAWLHEMKWDGYRMLCRIEKGDVRMMSRNGKEWTSNFPTIVRALTRLPVETAWLDGEVVVMEGDGRTSFQALQNALTTDHAGKLQYYAFDVMHLNGYDLRQVPLIERKQVLETLLAAAPAALRFSAHIEGSGKAVYEQACKMKLEGVVSKRAQSVYRGGRCRDWLKVKCSLRQELVIGGYTDPEGTRTGFGALLLGVYDNGTLRYSGKVGTGFNETTLRDLHKKLRALEIDKPAFSNPPRGHEAKGAHWIKPELVGEIEFTEWTNDGTLRHPSFQGLREDKKAKEVVRERAAETEEVMSTPAPRKKTRITAAAPTSKPQAKRDIRSIRSQNSDDAGTKVAGIAISNPTKVLYPEAHITKYDLAVYYERIADRLVPHLRGRPLTLVRCPNGWEKSCFFQKHPDAKVSDLIDRVMIEESGGPAPYMIANSTEAVVALLQMGALELHVLGAAAPKLACPDRLVFDLDPADDVPFERVVEAVQLLRTLLEEIGLRVFMKTTGGKGLHLVVPVRPTLGWEDIKNFTGAVANLMVKSFPDRFVATMTKSKRHGKIFIDYFRNSEGATAIAPYSLRARKGAPVATPIAWAELAQDVRRDHFNVKNVPERLKALKKDPWADFFDVKQSITKAMMKNVGA